MRHRCYSNVRDPVTGVWAVQLSDWIKEINVVTLSRFLCSVTGTKETAFTFSAARVLMSGPCVVSGSEP